ncbi:MAG: hypothetical protein ABIP06_03225 [Pyrinomonadaceae bacterium]
MKKILFLSTLFAAILFVGNVKNVNAQRNGSVTWSGTVDDVVELTIRRQNVRVRTLSGTRYNNGSYDFDGGGLNRNSDNVDVDREEGRGKVYIVQRPNRRNNYTTIVRIEDKKGGPDRYRVRVKWN